MSGISGGKPGKAGYLPAAIGIVMIVYAGVSLPGMERADRLMTLVYLMVFIAGFFLLGVGLIRGLIWLVGRLRGKH
jgi:hypothetical protein